MPSELEPRPSITVATWNIHHAAPASGPVDLRGLSRTVAGLGADVVGLQEVERRVGRSRFRDQSRVAAEVAGLSAVYGPTRERGWFGQMGNALLTRREPTDVEFVELPGPGERRGAIAAWIDSAIGPIRVVVTHLQNSNDGNRAQAIEQLQFLLDHALAGGGPVIVMGDLNLRDEHAEPVFADFGFTVAATGPTFPAAMPRIRLDWIAVAGLRVGAARVGPAGPSDHLPVLAEISPQPVD